MNDLAQTFSETGDAARQEADQARKELATLDRGHRETQAKLEQAEGKLTRTQGKLKLTQGKLNQTQSDLEKTQTHVANLTHMFESLKGRRSVRYVLAGVETARPVRKVLSGIRRRALPSARASDPAVTASLEAGAPEASEVQPESSLEGEESTLVQRLVTDRADAGYSTSGPLVTIVIITRNGIHHMQRVLDGLSTRTAYEAFEVVVVDNESSDETVALCRQSWPFDVQVIENTMNRSFSEANNQALDLANGEYVLFLNNDIDPINPGWLGALVDALRENPERGAAGALLIYPQLYDGQVRAHATPLTVQHRGIRFRYEDRVPKGYNVGHGEDPLATPASDITSYPGVTAACMLVRSELLTEVGGFTEGYVYGTEDVDLCLKILNAGSKIVAVAGAALFHHEFGTQDELSQRIKRINRNWNRTLFLETWGPTLNKLMASERLQSERFWSAEGQPTVAITKAKDDEESRWEDFHTAGELGAAMETLGWNVVYAEELADRWYEMDQSIDLVICLLDSCDIRRLPPSARKVAWVRGSVDRWVAQPWFDKFDVVAASSVATAEIIRDRSSHDPVVVSVATNSERFAPQPANVTYESDFAFTGNHWGTNRNLINFLLARPEEKFVMFGKGWEAAPQFQRYWRGPAGYDDHPTIYSSAKIVLDIAAESTMRAGVVDARVLDALASGTIVISNNVVGSERLFEGKLPTFTTRDELRNHLDAYLENDELRERTASQLRAEVMERHSYPRPAKDLVTAVHAYNDRPRVRIKIGPPSWKIAEQWGDTHFARHFAAALAEQGFSTAIDVLADWDAPESQDGEIVVHLRGLVPYVPKRGQVNVLWVISHPDEVSGTECDAYDLVLVASDTFAEQLRDRTSTTVKTMLQATSPRVFTPCEPNPELETDLLFVGNSRGIMRPSVEMAIEKGLPLSVYGSGWADLIPSEYIIGEYFPNDRLAELYSSTKLLLNDHWRDMREVGFVSNRIFDALACGTVVVTDTVEGLDAVFPTGLPTFQDAESLADVVRTYLADDALRETVAAQGQATVLAHHTFDQRALMFAQLVRPLLDHQRAEIRL